jgi:Haemolysin-III related
LFGTSAAYHRLARSSTARRRLRRLDNSMISVLIAGTETPLCVLALPAVWGIPVLAAVWGAATAGVVVKAADIQGLAGVSDALYIILGWAVIVALPVLVVSVPASGLALMVTGASPTPLEQSSSSGVAPIRDPTCSASTRSGTPAPPRGRQPLRHGVAHRRVGGAPTSPGDRPWPRPRGDHRVSDCASSAPVIHLGSVRQLARHDRRRDDGVGTRRLPDEGRMRRNRRMRQHPGERFGRTVDHPGARWRWGRMSDSTRTSSTSPMVRCWVMASRSGR